jgi:hypothetical protein
LAQLESVLNDARKLPPKQRRHLAARLLEEGDAGSVAFEDERLEAMRVAAGDELFLADLTATMEDFKHADHNALCLMLGK